MAGMTAAARQPGYSLTENGWRTLLLSTSVIILAFTVYCLSQGITIIFMHLYYFPIVLLAYHYHKKGVILSAVLGLLYVALVIFFAFPDMEVISGALVRFVVFIGIAAVVSILSETLKKRELERNTIIANSEDGIFVVDLSSHMIAEANFRGTEMLGFTPGDMVNATLETIWQDTGERGRFHDLIKTNGNARNIEAHLTQKTGGTRIVLMSAGVLPENRVVLTVTDITDRENMLTEMRRLSEVRESIISNANVWLMVLDSYGRILEWNMAAEKISGYPAAEVIGGNEVWKLLYPEKNYRKEITGKITEIIKKDTYFENLQTTIVCRDGTQKNILWNTRGLPDIKGVIGHYIAIGVDISDRTRAEQASREYAEWYSTILRTTQDGYNLVDTTGRLIEVNDNYCRMTGFSREELLARSIYDQDANESRDVAVAHLQKILTTGSDRFETRHRTKDGWAIDVEISVVLQPQKKQFIVFVRDITGRKRAEKVLLESEEKFHTIADFTTDWEYWQGQDKQIIYMSPSCERFTGYTQQEFLADPHLLEAIVHPGDLTSVQEHNRTAWETHEALSVEFRIIRHDGTIRWISHACRQVCTAEGKTLGNRDITDQKIASQALLESEEKFRAFFTTSRDCVFITTVDGRWIDLSDSAVELFGYDSREELLQVNIRDLYADPGERARHIDIIRQKGFTREFPINLKKKDGMVINTLITSVIRKDKNGNVVGFQGTVRDITELKQIEEALRNSQQILRTVLDTIPVRVFWKDRDLYYLGCNAPFAQDAGFHEPEELIGKDDYQMGWHEQAELYRADDRQVIETGKPRMLIEEPQTTPDGRIIWLLTSKTPLHNASGGMSGVLGAYIDITERKRVEESLALSEYRYRILAESAQDVIIIINRDLRFTYVNSFGAIQFGKTPKEFIGMPLQALFPPQTYEKMSAILHEVFESGKPQHFELEIPLPSSSQWHDAHIVPLVDKNGNIFSALGISRDITELKDKETALKKAHDELEMRVRERTAELAHVNIELEDEINKRKRVNDHITKLSALKENLLAPVGLNEKLKLIADGIVEIFGADFARIWMINNADLCEKGCQHISVTEGPHVCRDRTRCLHLMSSSGRYTHIDGGHRRVPMGAYKIGRVANSEFPGFVTNDVTNDPRVHDHEWARSLGLVAFAGYRLSSPEGRPIGVLALFSRHKIEPWEEKLLEDIASTASQVILKGMADDALKESEERFRSLVETTSDFVWEVDSDGRYIYVSPKVRDLLGYEPAEVIGKTPFDLMLPEEAEKTGRLFQEIVAGKKLIVGLENINLHKDGRRIVLETNGVPVFDTYGNLLGYRGIDRDITGRKAAEERIIHSLHEKEILLREVHHRVRNNFQIIISLLSLQSRSIGDEKVSQAMKESQNRIQAMSFVHEKLYTSSDLARIDLEPYVKYMTSQLFNLFTVRPGAISLILDVKNIFVDINTAIPLGLVINELVSNTLKHAFPNGRKGQITISIHNDQTSLTLIYQDNGIGFSDSFDWRTTENLGFRLIRGLIDQLTGTIEQETCEGTRFIIRVMKKTDEEGGVHGTFNPVPE
jgi:PAS domain S-box-containing protein